MALDFTLKDIIHKIIVKFVPAFLPDAKKRYNLKTARQPELDIHGIAGKADIYNITTPPKVIEEGLTAGMELIYYLAADGYRIKTPVFNLNIKVRGEYDGNETHLPDGIFPEGRLQITGAFRAYLRNKVEVEFDGIEARDGFIAEAFDEASKLIDQAATIGNLLTIRGYGLKIDSDEAHEQDVGLFFEDDTGARVRATIVAVNVPRTIKVLVPAELAVGAEYRLVVVTQTLVNGGKAFLKEVRQVRADFTITAQA